MNIGILAMGSQGDVQPYLALGIGLRRAGHQVRLISHENQQQAAIEAGLDFWAVKGNVQEAIQTPEMQKVIGTGNFLKIQQVAARLVEDALFSWAQTGLQAAQGMDVLLAGMGGWSLACMLSEKLDIPLLETHVVPMTPTRHFPGVLFPAGVERLGPLANQLSHHVVQQMLWQGQRTADARVRKQVMQLPPAPFFGPRARKVQGEAPVLYGISPTVLPRPADWGNHIHLTGYWFVDPAPGWTPPADLLAFLEAGPPPVYIGFGSMAEKDPAQTTRWVLEAVQATGQRAVLSKGWGGLGQQDLPEGVFLTGAVPHSWLFPRMGAVIHHGGAGTTAAGLRAGVPSGVVPFFGDQPFWGNRIQQLGAGPAPLPRKNLSVQGLAQMIQKLTSDREMQARARDIGQAIRQERGLEVAAEHIERFGRRAQRATAST